MAYAARQQPTRSACALPNSTCEQACVCVMRYQRLLPGKHAACGIHPCLAHRCVQANQTYLEEASDTTVVTSAHTHWRYGMPVCAAEARERIPIPEPFQRTGIGCLLTS